MGKRALTAPAARAVFLDRDGVLNANVFNDDTRAWESPRTADAFQLNPGVTEALTALKAAGFRLIVISNQPNAAKRKATLATLADIHDRLVAALAAGGVTLDAAHYCYHHPEGIEPSLSGPCDCRKPSPHFLRLAAETFKLDLNACWMVGDRDSDIACGAAVGARTIFIDAPGAKPPGTGAVQPTFRATDLPAATEHILTTP